MQDWGFTVSVRRLVFCGAAALTILTGCSGGGGGGGSTSNPPASISVSVSPTTASLNQNGTQPFTATVANDAASAGVTWSIGTGAGALSSTTATSVTYTAPATIAANVAATVTLTATSVTDKTKTASATITLNPPPVAVTSVTASCSPSSVQTGNTSQCSAIVSGTGSPNSAVNWSVGGVPGGNSTVGTISSSGLYTAPGAVPAANPVTVTATSVQDNTKSGTASVTITAPASSITVASFSPQNALPGAVITITGSGFDATEGPTVVFTEPGGLAIPVTPTAVTATSITVTAPPFVNASTGAFASGSYSVSVNQSSGSSNAVAGMQIQSLPTTPSAPGTLTVAFLQSTHDFIVNQIESNVQSASFDTNDLNVALASEVTALNTILPGLNGVVAAPNTTYTIGTYAGQNVNVTAASLGQVDQMLLAMLAAQASLTPSSSAYPQETSGGGCQSAAAAAAYNDVTTNANPNAKQDIDAYYASLSAPPCSSPQAIQSGLNITLGLGAAAIAVMAVALPAEVALTALALPTAAVLSVAVLAAGGQIAIGGELGSASAAGIQLVQNGVQEFEELFKTLLAKGASLGFLHLLGVNNPDSWIGLAGGIIAGNSVLNAFVNGPPNSGGGAPTPITLSVTTSGSGTGTVGSYPGTIACGSAGGACSGNFATGATVVLAAVPDKGYVFTGWTAACTGTGSCSVVMSSNASVDASFGLPPGTVYEAPYSAPFQGTASDPNGGVYSAAADFTFGLNLTTNADGTITGSADIPVNVNISVVSCPAQDTCSADSFSVTVTGPVSGSNGNISGKLSSSGSSPLVLNFTGVVSANSINITGSFSYTFKGTSTNAPPTYTTLSGTISGLTLMQQQ